MKYTLQQPCDECPFLKGSGFTYKRLLEFAEGEFPCHKLCRVNEQDNFVPLNKNTPHCAGALIFNELRETPHQMMRICERLGCYDRTKLKMDAPVVRSAKDCANIPGTPLAGSSTERSRHGNGR